MIAAILRSIQKASAGRRLQRKSHGFTNGLEISCTFPMESKLVVQVWDWDRLTQDDLIGETIIDIENRYLSRHRGLCGLPAEYDT